MLMKETKNNINRLYHVLGSEESVLWKWFHIGVTSLPKAIYRFNATPIKLSVAFFTELVQKISVETQKTPNSQSNLRKKNRARGINLPDLRPHHKTTVIKTVIVLAQKQKYWPMEQDRKPRDKPTHLWAPYLWQRSQWYTMEKDSLFNK